MFVLQGGESILSEDFRAFWSVIPATVLDDMSIPANAKILYGVLSSLMRREGYCWPSNAQLAEAMHCSEDVVKRWVSALAEAGHSAGRAVHHALAGWVRGRMSRYVRG